MEEQLAKVKCPRCLGNGDEYIRVSQGLNAGDNILFDNYSKVECILCRGEKHVTREEADKYEEDRQWETRLGIALVCFIVAMGIFIIVTVVR